MLETCAKMDRKDFHKRVSASRRWRRMARFRVVGLVALATVTAVDAAAQLAAGGKEASRREPGTVFRDCPQCPEMVVVPAGSFMMGSPLSEKGRYFNEGPRHRVRIFEPLAVGKYEVTFAEWDACVSDGGCGGHNPKDYGWGRNKRPVINVSWNEARSYAGWLSRKTGKGVPFAVGVGVLGAGGDDGTVSHRVDDFDGLGELPRGERLRFGPEGGLSEEDGACGKLRSERFRVARHARERLGVG